MSENATLLAARLVPTCAKSVQPAPLQRSTRKPVSLLALSVHARLIWLLPTTVAVSPEGAGIEAGGGGGGGGGGGPLLSLHAPNAPITPPAVTTNAARIMKRGVTFIHLSLRWTSLRLRARPESCIPARNDREDGAQNHERAHQHHHGRSHTSLLDAPERQRRFFRATSCPGQRLNPASDRRADQWERVVPGEATLGLAADDPRDPFGKGHA